MSINRWNAKRDANEPAITGALRQVGAQYLYLDDVDLLVWFRRLHLLEVKMPDGRPTKTQQRLVAQGWPLVFVETPEAALRAVGAIL